MIIVTTNEIPAKKIKETLGLVRGNTVRARNIGRDIFAGLKNLVGGEISEYTKLLSTARDEAVQRMVKEAQQIGADAIVGVRFNTSNIAQGTSEILVYGTAVKFGE